MRTLHPFLFFLSIKFRSKQEEGKKKNHESIILSTNLKESYPALLPKVTKTSENLNNGHINVILSRWAAAPWA